MTEPLPGLGGSGRPVALVTLPDGQQILAEVLERSRSWDGGWWYRLRIVVTRCEQQPGAPDREWPLRIEFEARHPGVEPVSGQDYSEVPDVRQLPGLITITSRRGERMVHREGCWLLDSRPVGAKRVTRPEADVLRADGRARLCPGCLSPEVSS